MMKLTLLLVSALSANAFVLPGPVAAPPRCGVFMNEEPKKPFPKAGWTLSLNGGQRTIADVYKAQKKAADKENLYKNPVKLGGYNSDGWTTNSVK